MADPDGAKPLGDCRDDVIQRGIVIFSVAKRYMVSGM
jgi:hypothetical protein